MEVPDERLRSALELAFAVAVVRARQRPPVPPPASLRPFLRFQKLPPAALAPVRRAVDDDDAFREAVAAIATLDVVDRASWLWLHRPDGWEEELTELLAEEASSDESPSAGVRARSSARVEAGRLEAAEARHRRMATELQLLRQEITRSRAAIAKAEEESDRARARAVELERALARSRSRLERAGREREAAAVELADLRAAFEQARSRPAPEQAEPAPGRAGPSRPAGPAPEGSERPAGVAPAPGSDRLADPPASTVPPHVNGVPAAASTLPPAALEALGGAAAAAASLASALAGLAASLSVGSEATESSTLQPAATQVAGPSTPRSRRRRLPLKLPRGLREGTVEADTWLVTEAGARVVVDGYNVAMLGWPGQALADQRDRLLRSLDDLACRYHTSVLVIFDGADVGPVRGEPRRRVAVQFSPSTVSADDVIREVVATTPAAQPVVVVTNDGAIVRDVQADGANVVSSDGLLRVARR